MQLTYQFLQIYLYMLLIAGNTTVGDKKITDFVLFRMTVQESRKDSKTDQVLLTRFASQLKPVLDRR